MRTLLALALALVACSGSDRGDALPRDARPSATPRGPDPIVLRVPRAGGSATAYAYPELDSLVWTSAGSLPAIDRVLAFDAEQGLLSFVARDGTPGRLDLRMGTVGRDASVKLTGIEAATGDAIFGVGEGGTVTRLTIAGEPWSLTPPLPARAVLPQPDGWLLVVAARDDERVLWRLHPPERRLVDTVALPRGERTLRARAGDRLYFAADARLVGVVARDLEPVPSVEFDSPIRAMAATPSGDRVFVVTDSGRRVEVFDRYAEEVVERIRIPAPARDLRMDPLGRYVLVRPTVGDSAWVVSVSDAEMLGTVPTAWRADLPFVAPDGQVAVARGADVVFLQPETLAQGRRVAGGAADLWYQLAWSGFQPRAEGLDDPVEFATPAPRVEQPPPDTAAPPADSAAPPPRSDSVRGATPRPPAAAPAGFTVSFAALLNEERARELAGEIEVNGQRARVVVGQRSGVPIYRVVLGPYSTRADADRIGRATGRQYFVIEGSP